jgi:vacuolar-type H+-ATPase subunit E/Vma4
VRCAAALLPRVRALLPPGVAVRADPDVVGGLVATRAGGVVEIDATLATLLERLWPQLRLEVQP